MQSQIINVSDPFWLATLQQIRHDIYHLPQYSALEARRCKAVPEALLINDGKKIFFVPYLITQYSVVNSSLALQKSVLDVTSPYGYPGILLSPQAIDEPSFINNAINELKDVLRAKEICSAFFRLHPILNDGFDKISKSDKCKRVGETVGIDLTLPVSEIWRQTRPQYRTMINWSKKKGFTVKMVSPREHLEDFISIYTETMDRVHALENYYFEEQYFLGLIEALNEKIHLCVVELNEKIICAGLVTECNGVVQSHLRGVKNEFVQYSPSKLMFDYIRFWAKERGNRTFHMGGGVGSSKDSLYHFKAGFSKQRYPFLTLQLIVDEAKYSEMVELRAKSLNINLSALQTVNFFPAYSAPFGSLKIENNILI